MRSKRPSILQNLFSNEKKLHDNLSHSTTYQVTPDLVDRLGLETELEGHEGCVNCIDWNYSGKLMVTGSDDRTVIVWNPHTRTKVAHLRTQHTNNIFSVKFLPDSNDGKVATGAGDSRVSLIDVERNETMMFCSCHLGRVKKLAVSRDSPFILWSGAEDGTVRQMDLRESHTCSENTSEILVNLLVHTGSMAEIKTIAANPVRSELLAVGANDPYARLYDRRKIKPYTCKVGDRPMIGRPLIDRESPENQNLFSSGCASYFVPGHIPCRQSDYKRHNRSIAATHVAFDPSGQKLLVNLGGEQIYLYDIFDKVKPVYMSMELLQSPVSMVDDAKSKHVTPAVQMLKEQANAAYDKCQYNLAVDLYNEALVKCPNSALLISNKSAALMKRKWTGDVYEALRQSMRAIELDPQYMKAYYRVARCLLDLGMLTEAQQAISVFESKFPDQIDTRWFKTMKQDLTKLVDSEAKLSTNGHSRSSESSSRFETSEDGSEFVFVSTTRVFDKNRNLSELELAWRKDAGDYEQRFCGHCNTTTDIKEANFFGGDGQYVVAGSDDGSFFIWDRETTNIVRILRGDDSIVNCLQPHPTTCLLATSGIDSVVRLWSPRPEDFKNDRVVVDSASAALANQRRMESDPLQMMLISMGYNIPQSEEEEGEHDAPSHCRAS